MYGPVSGPPPSHPDAPCVVAPPQTLFLRRVSRARRSVYGAPQLAACSLQQTKAAAQNSASGSRHMLLNFTILLLQKRLLSNKLFFPPSVYFGREQGSGTKCFFPRDTTASLRGGSFVHCVGFSFHAPLKVPRHAIHTPMIVMGVLSQPAQQYITSYERSYTVAALQDQLESTFVA